MTFMLLLIQQLVFQICDSDTTRKIPYEWVRVLVQHDCYDAVEELRKRQLVVIIDTLLGVIGELLAPFSIVCYNRSCENRTVMLRIGVHSPALRLEFETGGSFK